MAVELPELEAEGRGELVGLEFAVVGTAAGSIGVAVA